MTFFLAGFGAFVFLRSLGCGELAALVARSPFGQGAAWPVVQTVQRDGICVEVLAPAPGLDPRELRRLGEDLTYRADPDAVEERQRKRFERRYLSFGITLDSVGTISGA